MANTVYQTAKTAILDGTIDLATASVYAALVTAAYTPNYTTDQYVSTVGSANIAARVALGTLSVSNGAFSAANPTFTSVPSGSAVTQVIVYINSGSDSTSQLIANFNVATSGLPVTPNGGNITVTWGADIFAM